MKKEVLINQNTLNIHIDKHKQCAQYSLLFWSTFNITFINVKKIEHNGVKHDFIKGTVHVVVCIQQWCMHCLWTFKPKKKELKSKYLLLFTDKQNLMKNMHICFNISLLLKAHIKYTLTVSFHDTFCQYLKATMMYLYEV